jgi:hypothetical protein
MASFAVRADTSALRDETDVLREWTLGTSLPTTPNVYAPRPLISLTVGAETKRYSTEEVYIA